MQRETLNETINLRIMENELSATDWQLNTLVWELMWWVSFFNAAFFKPLPVPLPVLTFEKSRVTTLGYYRVGLNDFAVRNQININRLYIDRPLFETLQTLVHEMVHSYEYTYLGKDARTKTWYHSKSFRNKMAEIGILTDPKGCHTAVGDPFRFLLKKHGVDVPHIREKGGLYVLPPKVKPKGKSKLKKWSCGCTNVRVAVQLKAVCLKCGNEFVLA